jgi:hypothetical protein
MENDIMIKDFHVSEKGHGSYWLLAPRIHHAAWRRCGRVAATGYSI